MSAQTAGPTVGGINQGFVLEEIVVGNCVETAGRISTASVDVKEAEHNGQRGCIYNLKSNPTFRQNLMKTMNMMISQFCFGWMFCQFGVALPDLQILLGIELDTASWLVSITNIGYLAGCLIAGLSANRWSDWWQLCICTLCLAVLTVALPWCPSVWLMLAVRCAQGISFGAVDTITHAKLFAVWKSDASTPIQIVYLVGGLGGILSPYCTQPFLAPAASEVADFNTSVVPAGSCNNSSWEECTDSLPPPGTSVQFAFLITGILWFCNSLLYLVMLLYLKGSTDAHPLSGSPKNTISAQKRKKPRKAIFVTIIGLLTIMQAILNGCDQSFVSYLMEFTITQLHWTKDKGATISSVLFIFYSIGNISYVLLSKSASTYTLLFGYGACCLAALLGFLMSSMFLVEWLSWVCVMLIGGCLSALIPAVFTFAAETVTPVTGRLASLFLVSASAGCFLSALAAGYLMEIFSHLWLVYLCLGQVVVFFVMYACIMYIYSKLPVPEEEDRGGR